MKKIPTDIAPIPRAIIAPYTIPSSPKNLPIKAPKAVEKKQTIPPQNQKTP